MSLFQDRFSDAEGVSLLAAGRYSAHSAKPGGDFVVTNGGARNAAGESLLYANVAPISADYDVEADVTFRAGTYFALGARINPDNSYFFGYLAGHNGGGGLQIFKRTEGQVAGGMTLVDGNTYHFKFSARGAVFTLFVDGEQQLTWTDPSAEAVIGRAGVYGYQVGAALKQFDNLTLTDTSEPARNPFALGCLGTSIIAGATLNSPATEAPPAIIKTRLETLTGHEITVVNRGQNGSRAGDFLPSTAAYVAAKADFVKAGVSVVQLMFQTNESSNNFAFTKAQYKADVKAICDDLLASDIKVALAQAPYFSPNSHSGYLYNAASLARMATYHEADAELVAEYDSPVARLGDQTAFAHFQQTYLTEVTPENGPEGTYYLHPNALGAAWLGNAQANALYADFYDVTAPGAPGLEAVAGNGQVALTATASLDPDTAGVEFYRDATPIHEAACGPGAVVSFIDEGLANGTAYSYTARTFDSARPARNESAFSAIRVITPLSAPTPPIGLVASASNAKVSISWGASATATGYELELDGLIFDAGNVLNYLDAGLENGVLRAYRIRAYNNSGSGAWSEPVFATPSLVVDVVVRARGVARAGLKYKLTMDAAAPVILNGEIEATRVFEAISNAAGVATFHDVVASSTLRDARRVDTYSLTDPVSGAVVRVRVSDGGGNVAAMIVT